MGMCQMPSKAMHVVHVQSPHPRIPGQIAGWLFYLGAEPLGTGLAWALGPSTKTLPCGGQTSIIMFP